jgi:hypothetical protein
MGKQASPSCASVADIPAFSKLNPADITEPRRQRRVDLALDYVLQPIINSTPMVAFAAETA